MHVQGVFVCMFLLFFLDYVLTLFADCILLLGGWFMFLLVRVFYFYFCLVLLFFFISCDLLYSHNLWYVYAGTELYIYYFKLTRKNIIKISKLPIDLNSVSKEKIKSYVCIQTRRLEARETSLRANESTRISWPISAQIGEIRQPITAPHFVNNIW